MNAAQKGFVYRLLLVGSPILPGFLLSGIADGRMLDVQNITDMDRLSGLNMVARLSFLFASIASITTLRYASKHKVRICEAAVFARLPRRYYAYYLRAVSLHRPDNAGEAGQGEQGQNPREYRYSYSPTRSGSALPACSQ